jgi:hypothetical protein
MDKRAWEFAVSKEDRFTLERRRKLISEIVSKKTTIHNALITTFGLKRAKCCDDVVGTITPDDLFEK